LIVVDPNEAKVDLRVTMMASKFILVLREEQKPLVLLSLINFNVCMEALNNSVTSFKVALQTSVK
jgi:hypothetical protein